VYLEDIHCQEVFGLDLNEEVDEFLNRKAKCPKCDKDLVMYLFQKKGNN